MSSIEKPQRSFSKSASFSLPDPWNTPPERDATPSKTVPLDPRHELVGAPTRDAIGPEGVPEALKLPQPSETVRSAVSILLEDELKLAARMDERLRGGVQDAIALLELAVCQA